jgi:hypothetical protein
MSSRAAVKKKSVRHQIIEALGGRCMWPGGCTMGPNCGPQTDPDMLHVEHVYGNGGHERRTLGRRKEAITLAQNGTRASTSPGYYLIILERVLEGSNQYQLLCANHNSKKLAIDRRCKKWEGEPPCPYLV